MFRFARRASKARWFCFFAHNWLKMSHELESELKPAKIGKMMQLTIRPYLFYTADGENNNLIKYLSISAVLAAILVCAFLTQRYVAKRYRQRADQRKSEWYPTWLKQKLITRTLSGEKRTYIKERVVCTISNYRAVFNSVS